MTRTVYFDCSCMYGQTQSNISLVCNKSGIRLAKKGKAEPSGGLLICINAYLVTEFIIYSLELISFARTVFITFFGVTSLILVRFVLYIGLFLFLQQGIVNLVFVYTSKIQAARRMPSLPCLTVLSNFSPYTVCTNPQGKDRHINH